MKKRILAALMSASLFIGCMPYAFASDIDGHWAEKYITYLHDEGVINPSSQTGDYSPSQNIQRAEFMRYVNRAFHFTEKAEINYVDVSPNDWFYETVQIAEKYGYIAGVGNNMMDPEGYITREQAATIIGRLYKTTTADAVSPSQLNFTDRASIHDWSAGYIYDAVKKGYLVGYPDGTFMPQNTITRAEISRVLYSYLGNSLSKEGASYSGADLRNDVENVTISESCTLSNAEIGGDLYITEGLGSDPVTLKDITLYGTLVISGGNVTLENVDAPMVVIGSSMNRLVQVTASGNTNISVTDIQSTASLKEVNLDVSASGFSDVDITGSSATTVTLDGSLWTLNMLGNASMTLSSNAVINTLNMKAAGNVAGYGRIMQANILENGSNIAILPDSYQFGNGISGIINGTEMQAQVTASLTPSQLDLDRANLSTFSSYYDFYYSGTTSTVSTVSLDGKILTLNSDYLISSGKIRLTSSFVKSLTASGTYSLDILFADGAKATLPITISNSALNTVSPASATFDKNTSSTGYVPLSFHVTSASGVSVSSVYANGRTLSSGTDYSYQSLTGVVQLYPSFLQTCPTGTNNITFRMSKNNDVTVQVKVQDSTPVNSLSESTVEFDANTDSPAYQDVTVQLTTVGGAQLNQITLIGSETVVLDEGWHYTVNGDSITINRSALAAQAKNGREFVDLRFSMSSGVNPVLRVTFMNTYSVRVAVVDDLGAPVANASVYLTPQTDVSQSNVSVAQEKLTDSTGVATFYVKRGNYTIELSGSNFQNQSRNISVSSSQNLSFTATIEETIQIVVTESSGAKISGAVVTLDNQTVTTGADGIANFTTTRGTHTLTIVAPGYLTYSNRTFLVESSTVQRIILS